MKRINRIKSKQMKRIILDKSKQLGGIAATKRIDKLINSIK